MSRRRAAAALLSTLSRQNPFKKSLLYSSSSNGDSLQGLLDPDLDAAAAPKHAPVSAKDFTFLEAKAADGTGERPGNFSEDAVSIASRIRSNLLDFDEKFLRQFRGKLDEALVVEVLSLVKAPEPAVRFFVWAGRQIGYCHTRRTYDALLDVMGFEKSTRVSPEFLSEIGKEDREVLGRLLNVLVRKCCRHGFWNEALEELGRLKDYGYRPSRATYNALIQVLLGAGRLDSAFLVHREMSDSGFCLDRFTMGSFAHSLCRAGRWEEALGIVEKEDVALDTVLCTQMISGLLEASLFEEAMSFLHRMRSNSCVPNVVTYRTLLSGFLKKKQLGWCKRIVNMMITEGCYPNPALFRSLVNAYCISGDFAYAFKLFKRMQSCGCPPDYATYNIFIGGICGSEELPSEQTLELAERAYGEMLDAGFVLNKVNVANFARCLCGSGKFDRALHVIKEMMSKGFVPDNSTYSKVIDFLCRACKMEEAFILFTEMKNNGITPDVYTYTILIDSFCKVGLIQQAQSWFDDMIRDGCTPNVVTYTALIHAYLKARRVSKANELFNSMIVNGSLPNVVTYTSMIDGLCKAGDTEKACHIYDKMRGTCEATDVDKYFEGTGGNIPEPNVFTYGALVDGLCKTHKNVEARDLLEAMSSAGCEPNNIIYDALIDGFCKVGKLDEAQEIFVIMSRRGYTPSVYTYSSLIDRLFKDGRLDLVMKVLSKMLENSCSPNVITYTEMVDGLCKVGKTEEAFKLLGLMEEKGCPPNVVTYTAMIDGFGKAGKVDMCLDLFSQMTAKGCAPNFITYRILINHCCQAGLLDEAHDLLEEMKQTYWPKYLAGYQNVIQGFNKKFLTSLGLLDEIAEYGSVPIAPAYTILIDAFCKAGRMEIALDLHKEVMNTPTLVGLSLNQYSSLIEALCLASMVEEAFEQYSEMTRRGYVPEFSLLICLIKGLLRVNKWDEALLLSYSVHHMGIQWHIEGKL
ncbi:pentatricopeptide repeat-containing protein, mitochondrial-like [Iris pallida]|uniref:Pentatricopeptide repeat-containing protein, mitochondrial-like n=1 Tax=Iris pallida TaxID=29817 RepID=A0AAX6HKI1_IRIPA|nr:pentatricopeptide repeat-containing protein, mitochondrial-like [Iris pallida]